MNKYLLVALLGMNAAHASDLTDEQAFLGEMPVVLSASRLLQPQSEAPNAMTVIDRQMIKASGLRSIPDLFRMVPGMYVSHYTGSQAMVSYHGTTDQYARRMQVKVDGRTIYMPMLGQVNWEDLPLHIDDIERIEVVRGPAAAAYGANSTQGIINIVTREAGAFNGTHFTLGGGQSGAAEVSLRRGGHWREIDYRFTVGYRASEGYAENAWGIQNDSFATRLFNFRAAYHVDSANDLDVQFGYNGGVRGDGWNDSLSNTPHDQRSRSDFQQISWHHVLANGDDWQLNYSHLGESIDNVTATRPLPLVFSLDTSRRTQRHDIEWQHTARAGEQHRVVWGAALRRDALDAPNLLSAPRAVNEQRLFAHDEWRFHPDWLLNSGVMAERNAFGRSDLSPRVALNWHVANGQTLRMGLSRAYRNPSLIEEAGDYRMRQGPFLVQFLRASGGLQPEKMLSRELGYLGEFAALDLTADVRVYHDQLQDVIYVRSVPFPASLTGRTLDTENAFDVDQSGLELALKRRWGEGHSALFNYAYQTAVSSNPLYPKAIPAHTIFLQYSKGWSDWGSVSLDYYQLSGHQPFDRGALDVQHLVRRCDVRVAKFLGDSGGGQSELSLGVQNLFNQYQTDYLRNNQFPRRAYLKLDIAY